ncbi:hypothetical protein [Candidatus Viridilinea mediisalina]|uniref:Uncharacterized protein n=1 Tax=Candidatus Viridilinea mediisalina TaxID=2024553 RepID=A0A2A6RNS2_9CHLR|nr:hypothetical protein [Candidatus Viridilinea mediisalina]PDW04697.1 hypothetical protein CJ255_02030 [Candidatus Viridilinea mediisalina]
MSNPQQTKTNTSSADVFDAAEAFGSNLARVGTMMVTWPLFVLPEEPRKEAVQATNSLFDSVGKLHLGMVKVVFRGVSNVTGEINRFVTESSSGSGSSKTATKVPIETQR